MSPQINKGNSRQSRVCQASAIIVGSGLAGLVGAIKLAKNNIDVAIVTKKGAGKASNAAYSMGLFTCAGNKLDKEKHLEMSLEAGENINQKDILSMMVDKAPEAFDYTINDLDIELENWENGFIYNKGEIIFPGSNITTKLTEMAKNLGVKFYTHHLPIEILVDNGQCKGLLTLNEDNLPVFFKARNVFLASGGFGGAFKNTDNPPSIKGEGVVLAYRAGAKLKDLEFIQFFPLGLRDNRLPSFIAPPLYPKSAVLVNDKDENLIRKHFQEDMDLNTATQRKRDKLSIILEREWQEGQVYLDMRACEKTEWQNLNSTPIYNNFNFNFDEDKFNVGPTAHHTMGGIKIDNNLDTGIRGLYAAGEVVGGVHGANRLGGNALTEAIVFGIECAKKIENELKEDKNYNLDPVNITCKNPLAAMLLTSGLSGEGKDNTKQNENNISDLNIKEYENKLRNLYTNTLSPIREEEQLKTGIKEAKKLRKEVLNLAVDIKEKDLKKLITLEMAAQLLELAGFSALLRTESRGGHYRKDYPDINEDFKTSICWHNDKYYYE